MMLEINVYEADFPVENEKLKKVTNFTIMLQLSNIKWICNKGNKVKSLNFDIVYFLTLLDSITNN